MIRRLFTCYTEPLLVIGLLHKLSDQNCQLFGIYKAILKFQFTIFQTGLVYMGKCQKINLRLELYKRTIIFYEFELNFFCIFL